MLGWLFGSAFMALLLSWLVIKIWDTFGGVSGSVGTVIRFVIFVAVWAAVTAKLGMRGFTRKVRQFRQGSAAAIKVLAKNARP